MKWLFTLTKNRLSVVSVTYLSGGNQKRTNTRGLFISKKSDSSVSSVIKSLDGALTEINMKKRLASTIDLLGKSVNKTVNLLRKAIIIARY